MCVSNWPHLCTHAPVQGQALGIHRACLFPEPANSVSPAAVPWTSPCNHSLVRNVEPHFLRALGEAGVQAELGVVLLPAIDQRAILVLS